MTNHTQIDADITLTEAAVARVQQFLAKEGGCGLYLDVRRTGCSGWAYELEIAHGRPVGDEVLIQDQGIDVFVTPKALGMMQGTVIDFVHDGLVAEFRFKNPNVQAECGCGESFTVQAPASSTVPSG